MKKWIIRGVILTVLALVIFTVQQVLALSKEKEEFYALREMLDEQYFPILKDSASFYEEIPELSSDIDDFTWILSDYINWYLIEGGMEEYFKNKNTFEAAETVIWNYPVSTEDAIALKNNVLQTISLNLETLDDIDTDSTADPDIVEEPSTRLLDNLTQNVNSIEVKVEEMNKILSKYYH